MPNDAKCGYYSASLTELFKTWRETMPVEVTPETVEGALFAAFLRGGLQLAEVMNHLVVHHGDDVAKRWVKRAELEVVTLSRLIQRFGGDDHHLRHGIGEAAAEAARLIEEGVECTIEYHPDAEIRFVVVSTQEELAQSSSDAAPAALTAFLATGGKVN